MKRIFACLANSKKNSERCVAGIELTRSSNGYSIIRSSDEPRWIRPVSKKEHGEVPIELVDNIKLLDIVEMDALKDAPQGYQSENVLYSENGFMVLSKTPLSTKYLDKFVSHHHSSLFLNRGKAVSADHIKELDHSLIFIKPTKVKFLITPTSKGQLQTRATFCYENTFYDLPITDVEFIVQYSLRPNNFVDLKNTYFTISLGLEFQSWHSKLIAGVICF